MTAISLGIQTFCNHVSTLNDGKSLLLVPATIAVIIWWPWKPAIHVSGYQCIRQRVSVHLLTMPGRCTGVAQPCCLYLSPPVSAHLQPPCPPDPTTAMSWTTVNIWMNATTKYCWNLFQKKVWKMGGNIKHNWYCITKWSYLDVLH